MLERATEAAPAPQVAAPARAPSAAAPSRPALRLQSRAGNQAFVDLLGQAGIQAKLLVGAVHDPEEVEADRIADRVLRSLSAAPPAPPADAPGGAPGHLSRRFRRRSEVARRHAARGAAPDTPSPEPAPTLRSSALPPMAATTEPGRPLNTEAFAHPVDAFELRRTEAPAVRRFMSVKDFEFVTYEGRGVGKSTAQSTITKLLSQYARLGKQIPVTERTGPGLGTSVQADDDKIDAALTLIAAMETVTDAYLENKEKKRQDGKSSFKASRFVGFQQFKAALTTEREKLEGRKAALAGPAATQADVKVDTSGVQKVVDHYEDNLGSSLAKCAKAIQALCTVDGDQVEFVTTLKIPIPPAFFVGATLRFNAGRDEGKTSVDLVALFTGGINVGIADINAGLGGYFKSSGKDATAAVKLISYGMFRKCRESSVIPSSVASSIWGDGKDDVDGEQWALRVEESELAEDADAFVEIGGAGEVGASVDAGVAGAEGRVTAKAGKRWDKASLDAAKGTDGGPGAGIESTPGASTARETRTVELSGSASVGLPGAAGMSVAYDRQATWPVEDTEENADLVNVHWELKGNTTFPGAGFAAQVALGASKFALWVKDQALGEWEKQDSKSLAKASATKGYAIASATATGLDGVGFGDWCTQRIADPEATPSTDKAGASTVGSRIGVEFAYTYDHSGTGDPTALFEVRQLVETSVKVPAILAVSLAKRKRIVGARKTGTGAWTLIG